MPVNNNSDNLNDQTMKQQQEFHDNMNDVSAGIKHFKSEVDAQTRATREVSADLGNLSDKLEETSNGVDKVNRALNLLPDELHSITETMNKNMAYISGDLKDSFVKGILNEKMWSVKAMLGKETEELRQAMESAQEALKIAEKSNDQEAIDYAQRKVQQTAEAYNARKNMTDSQKLNKKLAYDMKTELVKIGKQMFSDLWKYAQQILDQAYSKDKSTIDYSYYKTLQSDSFVQ